MLPFSRTWTERNLINLKKAGYKVLHLQRNNSKHQYMLETKCLESSFAEDNFGGMVSHKLTTSQQCTLMVKHSNSILVCFKV